MTNAIVSGQARTALLIDGDTLLSFDIDAPEILKPQRESDFHFLFGEATDLRFIQDTKQEDVLKELQSDYDKTCALDLALMLLDKHVSKTKPLISEALEELLTEESIIIYLESIFYAKPLPPGADTENALSVCKDIFPKTYNWLSNLIAKQDDITWVREVWDNIAIDVFGDEEKRADFQKVIIHEAIFRELVLQCHNNSKISFINIDAGKNKLITSLPNYRNVLQALFTPFRQSRISPEELRLLKDEKEHTVSRREKRRQSFNREEVSFNREEIKTNVQSQIEYITTVLKKRDIVLASRLTNELMVYQTGKGEPIHRVKSLCQIAQNAKELGFYKFQLELTERAKDLEYSDAWTQAQYGDALLQNSRFADALRTFEIAISFSVGKDIETEVVARNGYAEALKAQGRLAEALEIYQETMNSYPENVVAKNGYAEILKAQGKLDKAFEIYEEIIKSHPEDVVTRNGYAEILKAQGKLDKAFEIYEEIIKSHPEDVVTRNGYAEILKAQGKLDKALEIYQETMNSYPENVVAKNGYAEILKAQGKLDKAFEIYEEIIKSHPEDVVAKTSYAEILKAQGKLDKALEIYQETMNSHPENVVVKRGYAEILKAQGKLDKAFEIYEEIIKSHPEDVVAKTSYAEILKAQGKLDKALEIYQETMNSYPENVVAKNGYAEILKAQGKLDKALEIYQETIKSHPEDVVAKTSYAEILKAQGKLDKALEIYEEIIKSHPEDVVARNGYAEILKAQGKLDKALEIYQETMNSHPENVVVKTGYAEILKAQGKLDKAFEIYEEIIKSHPENVVAKNGYAEILKAQGKLDKALEIYQETMNSHPENVVVKTGYAEILKAQGKLDKSLEIYEEIIKSHPENVVSRNGLCGVLFALGRYNEALEKLPNDNLTSLSDWIGYHIRGMIMLRQGNLAEAVRIFEKGEKEDPIPSSREYFRSALAIARLKQGKFEQAGELLDKVTTPILQPAVNLFRAHAFGELKMFPEAKAAFLEYKNAPITRTVAGYRKESALELALEVDSRYVSNRIRNKSDIWVTDREEDLLLALEP